MCEFYGLGSSPTYYYLVTKQAMPTGLIVGQKFLVQSEISAAFDLRPSDVTELVSTGRLIVGDHWYLATQTPLVRK